MQNKLEATTAQFKQYVLSLRDVRNAGMLAFTIIVLLISFSGIKTIQMNYGLQKQIAQLQQETAVSKLENTNLALQKEYYNTDQYQEVTARENFGLAAAGETELIVPKNVALAHTVDMPTSGTDQPTPTLKQSFLQRNLQAWMNFFLNRSQAD